MRAVARVLVARSRWVLAATLLLTLAALSMMPRLGFNADVASFLQEGSAEGRELAALQERYGAEEPIMVLLTRADGGVFTDRDGLVLVARARDALASVGGVASVGSIVPERDPVFGRELTPELLEALPGALLASLRSGPAAELMVGDEGRTALLAVLPAGDEVAVARAVQATPLPDQVRAEYAGNPIVYAAVLDQLGWFLLVIPPAVFVLLLVVFTAALGSARMALLAIVPAVLGSLWTFGTIFALGLRVDIVTVIVPVFVIVMGSADGLHFVSHLQDAAARGQDRVERVASALREVGVPMILTTVSTAAGFLSLLATGLRPIQQLGTFVAVGIAFAGLVSFFALPALMSRLTIAPLRAPIGRGLVAAVTALAARRWVAWALALPLIAFAVAYLPRLEVATDPLFFFPENNPVRDGFERVEEAFGGATPLFGEFVLDREQPLEPQLAALRARSRSLEQLDGVRRVLSPADLAERLPTSQREALLAGEIEPPLGPMVAEDGLRFVLFPGPHDGRDLRAWREAAERAPEIRILTGTPMLFEVLGRQVARAQAVSLALAFALVALLLLVTYRRLLRTAVALVPMLLTVAVLLGFVAASGMHLNLITAIAASIVIGVGIDYAIHFMAALEHARRADPERPGWVRRALDVAGRPILANALGVAIGLSALQLSPLRPHHQISAIMWVAMVTSAITTLVVIPAFLPRSAVRGTINSIRRSR